MKKTILICVLLICMILSSLPVSATIAVEDSFTIDNETRSLLSASEDDTVIRVYLGYFMYGFSLRKPPEDIFNDGWSLMKTTYVIASDGENGNKTLINKSIIDGVAVQEIPSGPNPARKSEIIQTTLGFYELIDDNERILSVLGPFVKAQKTVYMHETHGNNIYIYYETNIGDYVYYKDRSKEVDEFLVPIETFYDYAKAVQDIRSVTSGGSGADAEVYDLSPYALSNYTAKPKNTLLNVLYCGVPVLLIVCGGIWLFVHKRKKF